MGRRKVRSDELRGELLAIATRLLADGGSSAVTTRAVAAGGDTSLAAVNELFGGKPGLIRAIFAEGFAWLAEDLRALEPSDDPQADVIELALAVRSFARRRPALYEVMFSRPFAEFHPDQEDVRASEVIYGIVVGRVAALLGSVHAKGAAKDVAIGMFAVVQGLVSLEASGLLGSGPESIDRRFRFTLAAALRGLVDTSADPHPGGNMLEEHQQFVPWEHPSPLLTAIGGFARHPTDPSHVGFTVDEPKTNARGFLHGGVIATIGDVAIGRALATRTDPPVPLVTINLSCDLVGTARAGEWVDVTITPTRVGRRLRAGTATFTTTRTIATVTALFMPSAPVDG